MTTNYVSYINALETQRHNRTMESLGWYEAKQKRRELDENVRHNYATELQASNKLSLDNWATRTAARREDERLRVDSAYKTDQIKSYAADREQRMRATELQSDTSKYVSEVQASASRYNTDVQSRTSKYVSDNQRAASKYSADSARQASMYAANTAAAASRYASDNALDASWNSTYYNYVVGRANASANYMNAETNRINSDVNWYNAETGRDRMLIDKTRLQTVDKINAEANLRRSNADAAKKYTDILVPWLSFVK